MAAGATRSGTTVSSGPTVTAGRPGRVGRLATETKAAFKTTEFFAYLAVLAGILIAGAAIKGAGTDEFRGDEVWLFATILTVGYMVSRGLAKSGSSEPYWSDSSQNHEKNGSGDRS
jgi:hypothetical protein